MVLQLDLQQKSFKVGRKTATAGGWGWRHIIKEAFALLTQPSRVRLLHLTTGKIEILPQKNLLGEPAVLIRSGVIALRERTKK